MPIDPDAPVMMTPMAKSRHVGQPEDLQRTRPAPKDMPFLFEDDIVLVTNCEDHPLDFTWARRATIVEPGESKGVRFAAAVNRLGDPRSMDGQVIRYEAPDGTRGVILERYDELKRLMALYGVREERLERHIRRREDGTQETVLGLVDLAPKVNVSTMDGTVIRFPCQDPKMLPYPVANTAKMKVDADTQRIVEGLRAENDSLRDQVSAMESKMDRLADLVDRMGQAKE